MAQFYLALDLGDRRVLRGITYRRLGCQDGIDPAHRRHSPLEKVYYPPERDHWPYQVAKIKGKLDKLPYRCRSPNGQPAPVPQHRNETQSNEELQHRLKNRGDPDQAQIVIYELPVDPLETFNFRVLLGVSTYNPNAGQRFLSAVGHGPKVLLDLLESVVNDL